LDQEVKKLHAQISLAAAVAYQLLIELADRSIPRFEAVVHFADASTQPFVVEGEVNDIAVAN